MGGKTEFKRCNKVRRAGAASERMSGLTAFGSLPMANLLKKRECLGTGKHRLRWVACLRRRIFYEGTMFTGETAFLRNLRMREECRVNL